MFRSPIPIPDKSRRIFNYMYLDMAGMGILSGTTIAFLAVYAARQGADPGQIGLLSAVPGLVNLLFALPAANWISNHSIGWSVFWASLISRVFYLGLVPLPMLLLPEAQIWIIIAMSFLMTIPGTAVVVGFNALFASIVPGEWRGHVVGIRNAALAVTATIMTFISGQVLDRVLFPHGYQIVFGIGFLGALLSCYSLYELSKISASGQESGKPPIDKKSSFGHQVLFIGGIKHFFNRWISSLRLDVMRGSYRKIMSLLFLWHFFQFMTIPCVTLFVVNQLRINDQWIGIANGLFNMTVFFGSLRLSKFVSRYGNKKLTGIGITVLGLFPILTSFGLPMYVLANFIGGIAWALASGGMYNYILENMPENDRPAYLAWYNLILNAAILLGSLLGPGLGAAIGLTTVLIIFGIGRILSGIAILRWG